MLHLTDIFEWLLWGAIMGVSGDPNVMSASINYLNLYGPTVMSGSIFSQVSFDGQMKHHYKYICRGHGHHHGYIDDNDSCRSVVYSTVDIYPECSSRSNSRSNDSTHEIVKVEYRKGSSNCTKKDKRTKHISMVCFFCWFCIIISFICLFIFRLNLILTLISNC